MAQPPLFYLQGDALPIDQRQFAFSSDTGPMAKLAAMYPPSTMPNNVYQAQGVNRDTITGRTREQEIAEPGIAERLNNVLTGYGAAPSAARDAVSRLTGHGSDRMMSVLDLVPAAGVANAIDTSYRKQDPLGMGLAVLGAGPVGGAAAGAIRTGVKAAADVVGDVLAPAASTAARSADAPLAALERMPVDASVGLRDNPAVKFEGVSPHEFTGTSQWKRFGDQYGVSNMGSPDDAAWTKSLVEYTTKDGRKFTVPGGVDSVEPFTYFDILHMKSQGINPNDVDPAIHQKIHDRFLKTMSQGEQTPERTFNQLAFAQISPNQPLTPNELAVARVMAKGPEDLKRIGEMIPWKHGDEETPRQVVGYKTVVNEKTGESTQKPITLREQLSSEIANKLGLGKGSEGGLGARGTADYTRIAETAQRIRENPDFFLFRGKDEGGQTNAQNWANFVERITNQTPGLSAKTGSLGAVWQNPEKADISAVDRHMGRMFDKEMFPSPEAHAKFQSDTLAKFNKGKPEAEQVASYDKLPGKLQMDAMFGYLNSHPSMKYRMAPGKGSNSGEGPVNPNLPAHLQPDEAKWVAEPKQATLISEPYKRVLQANADVANEAGQSVFGSQWMHWDRIRNRLEPHEIMFPGLERIPRMSMEQVHQARKELADAGYFASTKEIHPVTEEKVMRPVRPMTSASRAAYFTLPPLAAIGGLGAVRGTDENPPVY